MLIGPIWWWFNGVSPGQPGPAAPLECGLLIWFGAVFYGVDYA